MINFTAGYKRVLMPKTKQFDEAAVLQKARNVFWKQGYNGTSMDQLVKATGLSRSSIYDTFGDKHGLYIASLNAYKNEQYREMIATIPATLSARKKIEWLFRSNVNSSLDDRQRKGCFMLNTTTELANIDNSVNKIVCNNMSAMEELFTSLVKEGQVKGEINKRFTAKALGRHLLSSFNGLTLSGQTKPDKSMLEDIVRISLSVLD